MIALEAGKQYARTDGVAVHVVGKTHEGDWMVQTIDGPGQYRFIIGKYNDDGTHKFGLPAIIAEVTPPVFES